MPEVKFILDNHYLISYLIRHYSPERFKPEYIDQYKADLVNFQDHAFNISKDLYNILSGRVGISQHIALKGVKNDKVGKEIDKYISTLAKSSEFKIIRNQTEESLTLCENEWASNYNSTNDYMTTIGINLEEEFKIWMTHPAIKASGYLGENNISWSYQNYNPNENTIYVWHEMLHSFFKKGEKEHALIELICDEEMRKQLNGTDYPPFIGHSHLEKIKTEMLPNWKIYLKSGSTDIMSIVV